MSDDGDDEQWRTSEDEDEHRFDGSKSNFQNELSERQFDDEPFWTKTKMLVFGNLGKNLGEWV